ncbi:MAG: thermonuclease family protein [Candidatus Adiutrix sp.]|jgi:endonuclease YncB( thermonuclease family)|nr:thermonuclease family protein [Candidatus Adiutrix sp.]
MSYSRRSRRVISDSRLRRLALAGLALLAKRPLTGLLMLAAAAGLYWFQADQRPAGPGAREAPVPETFTGRVEQVHDGDTITVVTGGDGRSLKVRLYGLDAPEMSQNHGREARDFLRNLIQDREVQVEKQALDQYGRVVGLVRDSGLSLNLTMVASGQAWVYEQYCKRPICKEMQSAEKAARQKKLGLWQAARPREPWLWRREKHR